MVASRGKLRRMCLIYSKLKYSTDRNLYPTKFELVAYIESKDQSMSYSSLDKDIKDLKLDFDLEIKYNKYKNGYFLIDPPSIEEFKERIFEYLNLGL